MSSEQHEATGEEAASPAMLARMNALIASMKERPAVDGERVGRYRILRMLGSGGMGRVYEAVDERLDRSVAVKVLHQSMSEQHRHRLVREAQALARLSHPNVVHVYEIEEAAGETFVAMEIVRGRTLHEWAQQDPRPSWRACVEVYLQAGAGLAAAHAEGLVHRDFKPSNAIIDAKGRVRVVDFGLVRRADEHEAVATEGSAMPSDEDVDSSLTTTGTVVGTPAYMAPEQMSASDVDARCDQFSFCVSLYEAAYGERPFRCETMEALMVSVLAGRVRAAPKRTTVPAALRRVLLRGLSTVPDQRWPTMEALLAALEGLIVPKTRRWLVVGLAGALGAVGLGAGYYASGPEPAVAVTAPAVDAADQEQQAERLYEAGKIAFRQGLFDQAVEDWSRSYELSQEPLLLYNLSIGLVRRYELSRDVDDLRRARSVMKSFLSLAEADPTLEEEDARERIAEIEAMIAETVPDTNAR